MFFAISGFVIPDSLRGTRWEGLKAFAIRRFWRLYPPFWVAMLLMLWRSPGSLDGWDAVMLPSLGIRGGGFFHFWTLEVEFVFYFLVAALFLVFGRLGWKILLPGYLIISAFAVRKIIDPNAALNYDTLLPNLVVMLWGSLCREILRFDFYRWLRLSPKSDVNWGRSIALGLSSGVTVIILLMAYCGMRGTGRSYELAGLFGLLGFLFWSVLTPVRIRWLSYVGRWTYSTYLLHFLVIMAARKLIREYPFFTARSGTPLVFTGLCLLGSFVIGALAYRWIERPSDAVGKRLTAK